MIELIDIRKEPNGNHVRLGCSCGKPALFVHDFRDDQLLFCKACGALASHRRLALSLDLSPDTPVFWDNVRISDDCPMINVSVPVILDICQTNSDEVHPYAGRVTKLSPDHCLVRLASEMEGGSSLIGRKVALKSEEAPLNHGIQGCIKEEIRPNTGDPIAYYNIALGTLSLIAKSTIEDYYEHACGLSSHARVMLYANDREAERLTRCLGEVLPKAEIHRVDSDAAARRLFEQQAIDMALLPPHVSLMKIVTSVRKRTGGKPRVIGLLRDISSGATSQALMLGADEVLGYNCSLSEMWHVLQDNRKNSGQKAESDAPAEDLPAVGPGGTQRINQPNLSVLEHETIRMLCMASETHDANSSNHLMRMSAYSAAIATQLDWSSQRVSQLATASKLHDVGKIGVPDHVLKKTGTLSAEERAIMQQHARFGYHILQASNLATLRMGANIALRHHERWDGKGYPDGIGGESIPVEAQIVSVADVFDALTTARAYKPAWDNERAIEFIRSQSGQMFNPDVVEAFQRALPEIMRAQLRFIDDFRDVWTERRRHSRYALEPLPVAMEVVMPEQTFQPYALEGNLCNLSEGGAKLLVTNLNNDLYLQLTTARRWARLHTGEEFGARTEQIMCEIVWNDYYALPDPNACLLGLNFQKISPHMRETIRELVERVGQPINEATSPGMAAALGGAAATA